MNKNFTENNSENFLNYLRKHKRAAGFEQAIDVSSMA